jgi:hypothetical protein
MAALIAISEQDLRATHEVMRSECKLWPHDYDVAVADPIHSRLLKLRTLARLRRSSRPASQPHRNNGLDFKRRAAGEREES